MNWKLNTLVGPILGLLVSVSATIGQENLITNASFEVVPDPLPYTQGVLPSYWVSVNATPDTYSNDGSYGLLPSASGNFTGVEAYEGIRWVAAWSWPLEMFGQELPESLVPGTKYEMSGWLHQAVRPDLSNPGGYDVFLAESSNLDATKTRLGFLGPTSSVEDGWQYFSFSFVTTEDMTDRAFLLFTPIATGGDSAYPGLDLVYLALINTIPTADAGSDQTVEEGTLVTLTGAASTDPDGDELSFTWIQTDGPYVELSDPYGESPTFTAPLVDPGGALLEFELVVSDGELFSDPTTTTVWVSDINDPPICERAEASPGRLWPPDHTLVEIAIVGVTDSNNNDATITVTSVTQDEPVKGLRDGNSSPDAFVDEGIVLLRRERSSLGDGRVYRMEFTALDAQGGTCSGTVFACVPRSYKSVCVEGDEIHDSTQ